MCPQEHKSYLEPLNSPGSADLASMCPQEHKSYAVAFNAIAFLFMTLMVITA